MKVKKSVTKAAKKTTKRKAGKAKAAPAAKSVSKTGKKAGRKVGRPKKAAAAKKKVRAAAKAARPAKKAGGRGARYTGAHKSKLLDEYQTLRANGVKAMDAAKKVGVTYITINKWEKAAGRPKRGRPGRKPAGPKIKKRPGRPRKTTARAQKAQRASEQPAKARGGLVLVTPTGYRIEGVSTKDLISVLKSL